MNVFEINEVSCELDIMDADVMQTVHTALQQTTNDAQVVEGEDVVASIRRQCKAVRECFDTIFGPGIGTRILPKDHLGQAMDAFAELCNEVARQKATFGNHIDVLKAQYSPNRAARRSKKAE